MFHKTGVIAWRGFGINQFSSLDFDINGIKCIEKSQFSNVQTVIMG